MNLNHYYSANKIANKRDQIKKIFFYRVCGTGMGAAACLLKQQGLDVQGADSTFYPPMSDYLKSTEIPCYKIEEIKDEYLKEFDLIVVGNVIPKNSDDAKRIESLGVPFSSFPSALGALVLYHQNVVGVAGTHGKTTTTYFAMQVFKNLGLNPGYFIGGVLEQAPSSFYGDGSYFFIESDEYDSAYFEKVSKFRMYTIDNLILTSLEFDHADIYNSIEEIKSEFLSILPEVKKTFMPNTDYKAVRDLVDEYPQVCKEGEIYEYGLESSRGPKIIGQTPSQTEFSLFLGGEEVVFKTSVVGKHNILNLSSVVIFAFYEGFTVEKIQRAILNLSMVKRRQEIRGRYGQSIVIDDFAHHPKAVALTIEAIKERYPKSKVHVVMEPNSATARSSIFQEEFTQALSGADELFLTKINRPTSARMGQNLDLEKIINHHKGLGKKAQVVQNLNDLLSGLEPLKECEDIILILSNGTCLGLWESSFVEDLCEV